MSPEKLEQIRVQLLKEVTDPKLEEFFNTAFKNMKDFPSSVVHGCTELITESKVPDIQSAYILGSIAGIALVQAVEREG